MMIANKGKCFQCGHQIQQNIRNVCMFCGAELKGSQRFSEEEIEGIRARMKREDDLNELRRSNSKKNSKSGMPTGDSSGSWGGGIGGDIGYDLHCVACFVLYGTKQSTLFRRLNRELGDSKTK